VLDEKHYLGGVFSMAAQPFDFADPGGMTPPGGNTGTPGTAVPGFVPDLRKSENRITLALLIKI
jgi:hypothetical protein